MEDRQIVDLFWARSETAISETEKKYGRYCRYIAYRILDNDEDAKEIENDTYLRAWNSIPPARPNLLKAFLGAISRNLALDRYEKRNTQKRGGQAELALDELTDCIPNGDDGRELSELTALRDAMNRFIRSLPEKTQCIFVRRYWYSSPISEIAEEFAMKESSVSVLLLRTRKKLKAFLKKEGFDQ